MGNLKLWVNAARPKTLPASVSPVFVAAALAYADGCFRFGYVVLCVLVALFGQISSNFANEYFDFKSGADRDDRVGPERGVSKGLIQPRSMLYATLITLFLACLSGLVLVCLTDFRLILVGIAVALGVIAYSAGPFPLSYNGLGDVSVFVFYGLIPVCFSYFVQSGVFTGEVLLYSVVMGLMSTNILIVNNYRDYEEDRISKKRTTIVLFGRTFGKAFYAFNYLVSLGLMLFLIPETGLGKYIWLVLLAMAMTANFRFLLKNTGERLNILLARTAMLVLFISLIIVVELVL